jgi:hypothetical protein
MEMTEHSTQSNMQEREVTQNTFQNISRYDKQFVSLVLLTPNLVTEWLGFMLKIQESHEGWYHETLHRSSQSCFLYIQNVKMMAVLLKLSSKSENKALSHVCPTLTMKKYLENKPFAELSPC